MVHDFQDFFVYSRHFCHSSLRFVFIGSSANARSEWIGYSYREKLTLCRAAQRSDKGDFSRRHLTSGNVAIIWRQIIDGISGVESFTSFLSYE